MKAVAPHDRPREKLERLGPAGLGDNELLALVLGSGSRRRNALEIANDLLADVGGMHGLTRVTVGDLRRVAGIGGARAAQVLAAIELGRRTLARSGGERPNLKSPAQMAAYLLPLYGSGAVEQFGVVMLDSKSRLIRIRLVATGTVDSAVVHPREVFREAAAAAAAAIVLFHNHPSGDPTPSEDDLILTNRMISAGTVMGIEVVDHIILGEHRYCSLLEAGVIPRRG
jgi:DNA repair protein RadC